MIGRKVESKYYFDGDLSWHVACAGDEVKSLRTLEKLFGVRLAARDNWVQIEGKPEAVERTEAFLGELSGFYRIRRKQLETRDFEFLCRSFRDRREGDLRELLKERIDVSPKKREVLPRSRRQLDYVRAIRDRDVVFGIGPAGTGKTYLAMAMAVSEFLKGNVSRIILTRPARESGENLGFLPGSLEEKIMGIYLYLGSAGTFDIVSLRLEECSAEEAANAGAKIFRPSPDLPNFLRNSRLPFGPQSGWNFDRKAAPDWRISEEPGPSGAPYLTFRDTSLSSEPFQVAEPGQEHFISFSYKGKGKAVIPWRTVELPQSDSWKRVVLPILPGASLKGFSFILIADGALSVDAFQVSRRRGEYSSAGECEVALALPESQTANARIQFEDEPPEIRYLLTGKTDGVELAVTVADLYGRADSFTVAPKAPAGTIAFNRFPDAPRGQFRVEVQARKDGKAVSPINELVVTRLSRPKYWGKFAPNSPFGIHALPNAQTLLTLKAGGINATRLHAAARAQQGARIRPRDRLHKQSQTDRVRISLLCGR